MFSNLLNETKGFKYQITVNVLLKKHKHNGGIKFAPVYFNSLTKTVINHRLSCWLTCWIKKFKKGNNQHQKQPSKMFFWYHVRHINPSIEHPERIKKSDQKNPEKLDYDGIEFPVQEKDFIKIEVKKEYMH